MVVIVLLLTFVVMCALFRQAPMMEAHFILTTMRFENFLKGFQGVNHMPTKRHAFGEERDGTEPRRHFSRRRDYDFIATDEFNINEIDDDDDDDDAEWRRYTPIFRSAGTCL